jgi:RNA polymerase sigma-70 factor, ECF subfamily
MASMSTAEPSLQGHESVLKKQSFERLAGAHRREIKLHCYRMLGSLHEADDLVQETYLRAWRGFDSFDNGGSFRAWLYKIATNACLNALESRKSARRLMPDQMGGPLAVPIDHMPSGPATDVAWLEP